MLAACNNNPVSSIFCSETSVTLIGGEGYVSVELTSPSPWSATSTSNWVHLEPASGQGNAYVKISADFGGDESAKVLFVNNDGSFTLVVNRQKAARLPGVFSVSPNKKIHFSKGNLQYRASTETWQFASNQFDVIGDGNKNISNNFDGWIDLFGWSTGVMPTWTEPISTTTFYDWGANTISDAGEYSTGWRTLTSGEWSYLLSTRASHEALRGLATVNGVHGLVLLPDNWDGTGLPDFNPSLVSWMSNEYTQAQWAEIESSGAVFLPIAGRRDVKQVENVTEKGFYWSASSNDNTTALCFMINETAVGASPTPSKYGCSVRLVR